MSSNRVSEAVARPVRGAGQAGVAVAIVEFMDALGIHDFDGRAYAATVVLLSLVLSGLQALVENRTGKSILRNLPPKSVEVTDDDGTHGADSAHAERLDPMSGRHGWRGGELGRIDVTTVVLIALAVLGVLFIVSRL